MIKKLLLLSGFTLIPGIFIGVIDISFNSAAGENRELSWHSPATPRQQYPQAGSTTERLLQTEHFALQTQAETNISDTSQGPETVPPPKIISVAKIDGEIIISLRTENGSITSSKIGDIIDGGWAIINVSDRLDTVILSKGDISHEVDIFAAGKPQ